MPHIGLDFNGSTDYVDCGKDTSLDINDAITLEARIKTTQTTRGHIVSKAGQWMFCKQEASGKINVYLYGTTTEEWKSSDTVVNDNVWHHVVLTYDKDGGTNNGNFYLDNVPDGSFTSTGSITSSVPDLYIGAQQSAGYEGYFDGIIDDVRIWNRALSLEEITNCYIGTAPRNGLVAEWLMNEGSGATIYDTSVNSNDGTITGATWGNNLNHNPLIINVQMTEAEITRDVYITGFHWTGVSDGDLCSVKDNCTTPKQIWKAEAGGDGLDVSFKPQQPIPANGIYVDDLDGGTLFINLISSYG